MSLKYEPSSEPLHISYPPPPPQEYDDIVKAGTFPTHVTGDISKEWIVTMRVSL